MTTADTAQTAPASRAWRKPTRKTLCIAAMGLAVPLALVGLWAWLPMNEYLRAAVAWIDSTGPWGALAFVVVYVLCALVGIPRTLLNVAAGVLFSYPLAVVTVLAGATSAYTLTFTIARTVARDWVNRRIAGSPQVRKLLDLVETEGFKLILLVRMNPFIPGVLKGYGFGTTNVAFPTYLVASVLGFLPVALAHVYLGWAGGAAMLHEGGEPGTLEKSLLAGGVFVSIVLVAGVYLYGRRAMNRRYLES